jgi:hypothetical protein
MHLFQNRTTWYSPQRDISELPLSTVVEHGLTISASVQPRLNDPGIEMKYVTQRELLAALKMTVLGTSSPLHTWDSVSETFVQIVAKKHAHGILLVDDKDEIVSKRSLRFLLGLGCSSPSLYVVSFRAF